MSARGNVQFAYYLIGIAAGLVVLGTFTFGTVKSFTAHKHVSAWLLVVVGLAAIVVTVAAYLTGRKQRPTPSISSDVPAELIPQREEKLRAELAEAQEAVERALIETGVATSYIGNVRDFLMEIRESFALAKTPKAARERVEKLRDIIFNAVVEGINSTRGEQVRCIFFRPAKDEARGRVLRPRHQHGHAPEIEKLWLYPDDRSAAGRAFESGEPVYVDHDPHGDKRVQDVDYGGPEGQEPMQSLYCVPAYRPPDTDPYGVFSVSSTRPKAFTLADRQFVVVCASMLALAEFVIQIFGLMEKVEESFAPRRATGSSPENLELTDGPGTVSQATPEGQPSAKPPKKDAGSSRTPEPASPPPPPPDGSSGF